VKRRKKLTIQMRIMKFNYTFRGARSTGGEEPIGSIRNEARTPA
jgi:hypothetical protein